jgi:hypothetical protein
MKPFNVAQAGHGTGSVDVRAQSAMGREWLVKRLARTRRLHEASDATTERDVALLDIDGICRQHHPAVVQSEAILAGSPAYSRTMTRPGVGPIELGALRKTKRN